VCGCHQIYLCDFAEGESLHHEHGMTLVAVVLSDYCFSLGQISMKLWLWREVGCNRQQNKNQILLV
jgi:hypothetical protein